MSSALDHHADRVVSEMVAIGAEMHITPAGRNTPQTWFYAARPSMREALRRFRATLDVDRPGFGEAMVRAIERAKMAEAG